MGMSYTIVDTNRLNISFPVSKEELDYYCNNNEVIYYSDNVVMDSADGLKNKYPNVFAKYDVPSEIEVVDMIRKLALFMANAKAYELRADFKQMEAAKHVHWIDNHNGTISCSRCHTWFHKDDRYKHMHYCPYCNMKMEESEDEG